MSSITSLTTIDTFFPTHTFPDPTEEHTVTEIMDFDSPTSDSPDFSTASIKKTEEPTIEEPTLKVTPTKKRKKPTKGKVNKKQKLDGGRFAVPITRAPTYSQLDEIKAVGGCDELSIKTHAYLRIQIFTLTVIAFYGTANRSSPLKNREFSIKILSTYLQAGKATHYKEHGYHAAHDNAASGLRDNLRATILHEIINELVVSPKKKRFLAAKGFTEADFKFINDNISDPEKITKLFDEIWPIALSILFDTDTDLMISGTTETPTAVNLVCDKGVEAVIRPIIPQLLQKISTKALPPRDEPAYKCKPMIRTCEKLHEIIKKFFTTRIDDLNKHQTSIMDYQVHLLKLADYKKLPDDEIIPIIEKMGEMVEIIMPTKKVDREENLYQTKIGKNKKFVKNCLSGINNPRLDSLSNFKTWMVRKYDVLTKEVSDQITTISTYTKYMTLELEGSQLYRDTDEGYEDYDFFKTFLHPKESIAVIQERLWKPIPNDSPIKALLAKKFKRADLTPKRLDF